MGLTQKSFELSTEQINCINEHFTQRRKAYLDADEEVGTVSIKVEFEWVPGLGRFVTAHFDGEVKGMEVEEAGNSSMNSRALGPEKFSVPLRVFLDDERNTPEGWVRSYWPDEVIGLLKTGLVQEISLDHDLGDDQRGTGYDVLLWIEEAVSTEGFSPPILTVHSANPPARQKMLAAIASIETACQQSGGQRVPTPMATGHQ